MPLALGPKLRYPLIFFSKNFLEEKVGLQKKTAKPAFFVLAEQKKQQKVVVLVGTPGVEPGLYPPQGYGLPLSDVPRPRFYSRVIVFSPAL